MGEKTMIVIYTLAVSFILMVLGAGLYLSYFLVEKSTFLDKTIEYNAVPLLFISGNLLFLISILASIIKFIFTVQGS